MVVLLREPHAHTIDDVEEHVRCNLKVYAILRVEFDILASTICYLSCSIAYNHPVKYRDLRG